MVRAARIHRRHRPSRSLRFWREFRCDRALRHDDGAIVASAMKPTRQQNRLLREVTMTPVQGTTEAPARGRAFAVLIMLFLFQTLNFFDKLVFGLSAVPMMRELSLSSKEFGLIGSSFFLLFSLSDMTVGMFVIGRFPTKW